eukprot:CAMPEP_0197177348 /NCGR_PEP_ID=MMETSP1423-20130617/2982_1 /TAXON_ID=476441 /ORGANISM="Pseudo-nitzschia heimii, Strain UNC1101" /LENGTH=598 /DNA_ID=CAMNT_0042626881 /DNA_START=69 /DNA_END=1865 /DNA_ORIENTATION=+
MVTDERSEQESLLRGQQQQQSMLRPKHIRPKIQRKSPKGNKTKQDDKHAVRSQVAEIEETRKRMESWMGVGSKSGNESKNDQKIADRDADAEAMDLDRNNKGPGSHKNTKSKHGQPKDPVSILKTPKYSKKSQAPRVEAKSSALASTMSIGIGESATVISDVTPSVQIMTKNQPQKVSIEPENDCSTSGDMNLSKPVICKDIVVERDPTKAAKKMKSFRQIGRSKDQSNSNDQLLSSATANNYSSIEGYVPAGRGMETPMKMNRDVKIRVDDNTTESKMHTKGLSSSNDDDDDPLVIDSLEGLMRAAGKNLPENPEKITKDTKMVEANISFSVMTQDQYENNLPIMKEEQEEERKRQLQVFMGKHDIFGDCDDNESIEGAVDDDGIEDDDGDDDDAVMELLLGSDINSDDEDDDTSTGLQSKDRAFILLWNALTDWMTHDTVLWVKALRDNHEKERFSNNNNDGIASAKLGCNNDSKNIDTEWSPMVDRSDIGASRCAGVLAMIRLYLGQCMEELNHPLESRRKAEKRLNDIMRTFDYSRDNPKLTADHWKAMTCILLDAVLIESRDTLVSIPQSVAKIGMSMEEFEYLSRKSVLIFE